VTHYVVPLDDEAGGGNVPPGQLVVRYHNGAAVTPHGRVKGALRLRSSRQYLSIDELPAPAATTTAPTTAPAAHAAAATAATAATAANATTAPTTTPAPPTPRAAAPAAHAATAATTTTATTATCFTDLQLCHTGICIAFYLKIAQPLDADVRLVHSRAYSVGAIDVKTFK